MFDLRAEYQNLARSADIDWSALQGKTVLITGATGLIGASCVRFLMERNVLNAVATPAHSVLADTVSTNAAPIAAPVHAPDEPRVSNIQVIALVRNLEKAKQLFGDYAEEDSLSFCVSDLASFNQFDLPCDFIIHAGCPTASDFFMEHPVETAGVIIDGTRNMLELARRTHVESLVYVSSMEVYGNGNERPGLEHKLTEDEVGLVNPLSVRSCYPEGKRMAEHFTCAYAHEYGVDAKIARLAQTFGPGIPLDDKRVFAQFARCALKGEDIVLRTTGSSTRMYTYPTDAVVALFTILLKGSAGHAYNVANESTYSSVFDMATLVAHKYATENSSVRVELDPDAPYPPEHHLPLDTSALCALGWKPQVGLAQMYENLISYLQE